MPSKVKSKQPKKTPVASAGTVAPWVKSLERQVQAAAALIRRITSAISRFCAAHPKTMTVLKWLVVYTFFWLIAWQRLDPDFGWHLRSGQYIIKNGIPAKDIYTYSAPNFPWINHEWGYDVLIAHVYSWWHGWELLASLAALVWASALIVAARPRAQLYLLIIAAFAISPYAGIRPQALTLLFFVLLLRVHTYLKRKHGNFVWLIPLLFIPWANLHAGFVIGLALLAYFAIKERSPKWAAVFVLSILATFVNPYGPSLYVEVARTMFDRSLHTQIIEWYIFHVPTPSRGFIILWGATFWIYKKKKKFDTWFDLGPLMLLAAMSATRNIPLFVVVTVAEVGGYLRLTRKAIPKKLNTPSLAMLTLLAVVVFSWLYLSYGQTFAHFQTPRDSYYPVQSANYIREHGCEGGNLFNNYNFGGYLIWKLPEHKVFIDGRMPSWRDENGVKYLDRGGKIYTESAAQKAEFKKLNIRCAILGGGAQSRKLRERLLKQGWTQPFDQPNSIVLMAPKTSN